MGYFALIALLQVFACLHAVNRGFHYHFVALILIAPIVGPFIYFWMIYSPVLLPPMKNKICSLSQKKKDPYLEIARLFAEVQSYPTVNNSHRLAQLYIQIGELEAAMSLLEKLLQGHFASCPQLLAEKEKLQQIMSQKLRKSA
jgi:hypothetical protein